MIPVTWNTMGTVSCWVEQFIDTSNLVHYGHCQLLGGTVHDTSNLEHYGHCQLLGGTVH